MDRRRNIKAIIYGLTIGLLLIAMFIGILDTANIIKNYGWGYEQTTIINGVSTVTIVSVWSFMLAYIFIFWIISLLLFAIL